MTLDYVRKIVRLVLQETIRRLPSGKWAVYPKKGGKRLGTHDTEAAAKKQLAAIEISKKMSVGR